MTVTCFISMSLDYGHVRIKFGNFNIGELLKNSPIANINSSPINHLVRYTETQFLHCVMQVQLSIEKGYIEKLHQFYQENIKQCTKHVHASCRHTCIVTDHFWDKNLALSFTFKMVYFNLILAKINGRSSSV